MADFTINSLSTGTIANSDNFLKSDTSGALTKVSFSAIKENVKNECVTTDKVVNNFTTTDPGYVMDARAGKTLNDSIAKWFFGADAIAFRVASSKITDFGIRAISDDQSFVAATFDRYGLTTYALNSAGTSEWNSSFHMVTANAAANGTNTVRFTVPSYSNISLLNRRIMATCNGGSLNGQHIISVIPQSATTVDVNFSGNVGTTGDIFMTFMY